MISLGRLLSRIGAHLRKPKFTGSMDESDVHVWLTESGYITRSGNTSTYSYPPGADDALCVYIFNEYERRTGYPLSVARGRTGSMGPLCMPRVVDLLGRGHTKEYKHRIVERLLDVVIESGYWPEAFSVVRRDFERPVP